MKKVLLTGATGFIGQHAIPSLLAKGYEIHATTTHPVNTPSSDVQWHVCDLFNPDQTTALVAHLCPTHLLHFAWYTAPGKYWTSPLNLDWVRASLHLLQQFATNGGKRVVMAGTCAEYDWDTDLCREESTPLIPKALYGVCKASLYQMMNAYTKQIGLSSSWGRIFHLYGPREYPNRLTPSVIQSFLQKEIARCSHGTQLRDFLHVEDVADAFVTLLDSEIQGAINIGSGKPLTLKAVIEQIATKLDGKVQYGAFTPSALDPPVLVPQVKRLFEELQWSPRYTLDHGLNQTIAWWQEHGNKKP